MWQSNGVPLKEVAVFQKPMHFFGWSTIFLVTFDQQHVFKINSNTAVPPN